MSLSKLVSFEDLAALDGGDLRAVFGQVGLDQVVDALAGVAPPFRQRLLARLSAPTVEKINAQLAERGTIPFESALAAQGELVEALCRLSRGGQVAFDDPADMVA
jgi:flagellar motor switch protein FliG